jgi:hypothetical protein
MPVLMAALALERVRLLQNWMCKQLPEHLDWHHQLALMRRIYMQQILVAISTLVETTAQALHLVQTQGTHLFFGLLALIQWRSLPTAQNGCASAQAAG